jgi:hypothetical protein
MFIRCWVSRHSAGQGPANVLPAASELEIAMLGRWGEVFGDDVVAAMIDRLVHRGMNASGSIFVETGSLFDRR